jgi:hypothetical protein
MAGEHNADDMAQLAKAVYICCFDMYLFHKVNNELCFRACWSVGLYQASVERDIEMCDVALMYDRLVLALVLVL